VTCLRRLALLRDGNLHPQDVRLDDHPPTQTTETVFEPNHEARTRVLRIANKTLCTVAAAQFVSLMPSARTLVFPSAAWPIVQKCGREAARMLCALTGLPVRERQMLRLRALYTVRALLCTCTGCSLDEEQGIHDQGSTVGR
jgi:hypothetical protein